MKGIKLLIVLVCTTMLGAINSFAQPDSLVTFTGILISSISNEPVPGLTIIYKKLPYESEMGQLTTNSEGKFTAYFRANEKYSLLIDNEGYLKHSDIIDPMEGAKADFTNERVFHLNIGGVGSVMKLDNLKFAQGSANIVETSYKELDNLANMLKESPNLTIRLEGHTDYVGNPTANINLSQLRVDAVKKYLVDKGANGDKIETKAFGGSQPLIKSNSSSERAKNRRVEVRIISEGN